MADLSDVTSFLATTVAAVVYPNGNTSPSIAPAPVGFTNPMDVRIFEGWPNSDQLDLDLGGKVLSTGTPPVEIPRPNGPCANVSIFPMAGTGSTMYQVLDKTYIIDPVVLGLTVSVSGGAVTITGTPNVGEFVTIISDRSYVFSATGSSASVVLSALLTQAQVDYPGATLVGDVLTIPFSFAFVVRQGGIGTLGKVTHRQCHPVMVTVWAPDHNTRSVLSSAIDNVLKQHIVVTLPDGTDAKIVYSRTNVTDDHQTVSAYRRDLIYEVEYATLETFSGVTITNVSTGIVAGNDYYDPTIPPEVSIIT